MGHVGRARRCVAAGRMEEKVMLCESVYEHRTRTSIYELLFVYCLLSIYATHSQSSVKHIFWTGPIHCWLGITRFDCAMFCFIPTTVPHKDCFAITCSTCNPGRNDMVAISLQNYHYPHQPHIFECVLRRADCEPVRYRKFCSY